MNSNPADCCVGSAVSSGSKPSGWLIVVYTAADAAMQTYQHTRTYPGHASCPVDCGSQLGLLLRITSSSSGAWPDAENKGSTACAVHSFDIDVLDEVQDSQRWAFALGDLLFQSIISLILTLDRSSARRRFDGSLNAMYRIGR